MSPELAVFVGGFMVVMVLRNRGGRHVRRRSARSHNGIAVILEALLFLIGFALFLYGANFIASEPFTIEFDF